MLVAGAVAPHPPLLVPGVAAGAEDELDALREAAVSAVGSLVDAGLDLLVVVGAAETVGPFADGAWGSLAGYGVDVGVGGPNGGPTLPLSLTVGRWLLDAAQVATPRLMFGVTADASPQRCAELGATLADRADRVGLLAMGDGSGRRTQKPGYLDPRAEPFDDAVGDALARADGAALLDLDAALAGELLVAGRAAWQVLAGAAAAGGGWRGDLRYAAAPYGVWYAVATWWPSPSAPGEVTGASGRP